MTRQAKRSTRRASRPAPSHTDFDTVAVRHRHDGWTPEKQVAFIEALADSGCVDSACKRVGISTTAAYALRRRIDADSFRFAWDMALDYAVKRLSDAVYSRAIHGVAQPIFYKGEQVGERRHYDERLAMFLLRYRDPIRYGAWMDRCRAEGPPDGPAITLSRMTDQLAADAYARDAGGTAPEPFHRFVMPHFVTAAEVDEQEELVEEAIVRRKEAREAAAQREQDLADEASREEIARLRRKYNFAGDVPPTSPTSDGR